MQSNDKVSIYVLHMSIEFSLTHVQLESEKAVPSSEQDMDSGPEVWEEEQEEEEMKALQREEEEEEEEEEIVISLTPVQQEPHRSEVDYVRFNKFLT